MSTDILFLAEFSGGSPARSALELATGAEVYRERLSHRGSGFSGSPVAADGKLYLPSEDGDILVVQAGTEFRHIATNSLGSDGRPMTLRRLLLDRFGDPGWVARQLAGRFIPYSGWAFTARDVINWVRLRDDPTGIHIPILLPNPERGLFDAIEGAQFADGGRFDFRGEGDFMNTGNIIAGNLKVSEALATVVANHTTPAISK